MFNNYTQYEKPNVSRLTFSGRKDPLSKKIQALDNSSYQPTNYHSEIGISITTNELGTKASYEKLSSSKAPKNSCHIGVSGWYNLDVIAARRSERGIIFDSNPDVALFFDHTFRCIIDSEDRETFIREMKIRIKTFDYDQLNIPKNLLKYSVRFTPNITYAFETDLTPQHEVDIHAQNSEGWLANEDCYQFIRSLVLNNKIVALTEDITHPYIFRNIHRFLEDNGICVDTLYVSNVHNYISKKNEHAFLETISCVSDDNTLLIDTEANLKQRISNYRELKSLENQSERWFSSPSTMISNQVNLSCAKTFFDKSADKKKTNSNCSFIWLMAIIVVLSTYLLNQSDVSPQLKP